MDWIKWMALWVIGLMHLPVLAQWQGSVVDSLSGAPLGYVSIWATESHFGTSAEENGVFKAPDALLGKPLLFSFIGYRSKKTIAKANMRVLLVPEALELQTVTISPLLHKKSQEIGVETGIFQAFDNSPNIDLKFYPYLSDYSRTRYLDQLTLMTDSKVPAATVKIGLYAANTEGLPGPALLSSPLLLKVSQGVRRTRLDLSDKTLVFPKTGLFVVVEKIMTEGNLWVKAGQDRNVLAQAERREFHPFVLYKRVQRDRHWRFEHGQWTVQMAAQPNSSQYEPDIRLWLTN